MITRRSVWSDERVQHLLKSFVPAADEVWGLQHGDDPASRIFQKLAEQGHYAGRVKPTNTRQGIYATAPNGVLLASVNTRDAGRVADMLEEALRKWASMAPDERMLSDEEAARIASSPGWERLYPDDGLVLRVVARDIPRAKQMGDWRDAAWNRDYAWFRKAELVPLVPGADGADVQPGARGRLPDEVARRVAALHLTDYVRGQVPPFDRKDVREAAIESEVVGVEDGLVRLRLTGRTSTMQRGRWPVAGYEDMNDPKAQERGVEVELYGHATWDLDAARFTEFELIAIGQRWGGSQYNGRKGDLEPAGIGYLMTIADEEVRVPPAAVWGYGW